MAAFNISVDDSSPLITYFPLNAWIDTPANDTLAAFYAQSSFHATSVGGAYAEFAFNGTGIWLYGARRPDYGSYTVLVDNNVVAHTNATAANSTVGQFLGGTSNLPMGQHNVVLRNAGTGPMDIDSLVLETQIGSTGDSVITTNIDDSSSRFTYTPSVRWALVDDSQFYNNTLHYSDAGGAQASLSFSGDGVAVYGTVSPQHGNYTVTLNGHISQIINGGADGFVRQLHAQTLLFSAENLGAGMHCLVVTGNSGQNNTGHYVDVDYVTVYTASNSSEASVTSSGNVAGMTGSSVPTSSSPNPSGTGQDGDGFNTGPTQPNNNVSMKPAPGMSQGAVVGAVLGTILGVVILLVLLYFFVKRRRTRSVGKDAPTPALPIQDPDLELGTYEVGDEEDEKAADSDIVVSEKRMTTASMASRWSQASFESSPTLRPPSHDPSVGMKFETMGPGHGRQVSEASTFVEIADMYRYSRPDLEVPRDDLRWEDAEPNVPPLQVLADKGLN
ncbi:hypothetical protein BKA93DRAFT_755971 [Sparassis latifolia]